MYFNARRINKLMDELIKSWVKSYTFNPCEKCKDGELEKTMTLSTEENELEYWNCNNCPNQNVVCNDL